MKSTEMERCNSPSPDSSSESHCRTPSLSLSSVAPAPIVEPVDYYSERRFHPVHLMDTFHGTRFKVIRKLGYGSFSTVWLARDRQLACYVALKVGRAAKEPTVELAIYRRIAETELQAHPGRAHCLGLQDFFTISGPYGQHPIWVYQPMAASVSEVQDNIFPAGFPLATARSILWQTLLGLDFLLANGIVHGDLQPRNILFTVKDLNDRPVPELTQQMQVRMPVTPICSLVKTPGVKLPNYLVPADPLIGYLDTSSPFTVVLSDLGGSFFAANPPSTPVPPLPFRAPETIFQKRISDKQDMWSFGCLIFEFLTGITLFALDDLPISELTDPMHFVDMYNVLGFPQDQALRDRQWPGWREYFTPGGGPINHPVRVRPRDLDADGHQVVFQLDGMLERTIGTHHGPEEVGTIKDLLRGLLEFDPDKRLTTKDVIQHRWFSQKLSEVDPLCYHYVART